MDLLFFCSVLWLSFVFAKLEIAIEGRYGWAENLPTWRLPAGHWLSRCVFGGKPATGYHTWMELTVLTMLHLPYLYVFPTVAIEAHILAFFCFFSIAEDFLWFALNPAFGIANFRASRIWWHRSNWWIFAPRDYFVLLAIGAALFAYANTTVN